MKTLVLLLCSLIVCQAKCPNCAEKQCHADQRENPHYELRLDVPLRLSRYQDYHIADDTLRHIISNQINLELQAFYTYTSMASYFDRDDVALNGFRTFFQNSANEELSHAMHIMSYMNKRGSPVLFGNLSSPCENSLLSAENSVSDTPLSDCDGVKVKIVRKPESEHGLTNCDWRDPLTAVTVARQLEINVYRSIRSISLHGDRHKDPNVINFFDDMLQEQVDSIKSLSDMITQLRRVEPCIGYYMIDKELSAKLNK